LWLWWVVASVAATFVGFLGAVVVIVATGEDEPTDPYFMVVFPLIIAGVGAVLAASQLLVLRRAIGPLRGWVTLSAAGLGIGIAVALVLPEGEGLAGAVVAGAGHGAAIGVVIGTVQWLALRSRLRYARAWLPLNVVAWSVGAATGDFVGHYADGPLDLVTGFCVANVIVGAGFAVLVSRRGASLSPGMSDAARVEGRVGGPVAGRTP